MDPHRDEAAFAVSQAGLWPFATLPACFLWVFRGWLFIWLAFLPMVYLVYRNLWTLLGLTVGVAVLAAAQHAFNGHWNDLQRALRRLINPRRRPACRPPPRWPKEYR